MRAFILLVLLLSATLLASTMPTPAFAQPIPQTLLTQKTQAACSFLKSLYNPPLGLVRRTPNSSLYYIASDNLLAQKATSSCDPTISQGISQSIFCCGYYGQDGIHDVLLGVGIQLPIHHPTTYVVSNSSAGGQLFRGVTPAMAGGNYTILWERAKYDPATFPDCAYADITVYTALELKVVESNSTGAQREMDCLTAMFDGRGMVDEAYKDGSISQHGIYQTLKLALYIYALQKVSGGSYPGLVENLLRLQGLDGGFHTGYDQMETYSGTQENAETTSIAIIALSSVSTTNPFSFPFFSVSSWIIYFFAAWAVIGVGVVAMVLFLEKRKRKQTFQISPAPIHS